tara:strand:- start:1353 stop:2216 length:864 start_codon:yes stop_codon:yes gene_type:complete
MTANVRQKTQVFAKITFATTKLNALPNAPTATEVYVLLVRSAMTQQAKNLGRAKQPTRAKMIAIAPRVVRSVKAELVKRSAEPLFAPIATQPPAPKATGATTQQPKQSGHVVVPSRVKTTVNVSLKTPASAKMVSVTRPSNAPTCVQTAMDRHVQQVRLATMQRPRLSGHVAALSRAKTTVNVSLKTPASAKTVSVTRPSNVPTCAQTVTEVCVQQVMSVSTPKPKPSGHVQRRQRVKTIVIAMQQVQVSVKAVAVQRLSTEFQTAQAVQTQRVKMARAVLMLRPKK